MAEHFAGFPRGGLEFLAGLAADNSRSFFDTHRRSYERDMRAPMRLFVTDVAALLRSTVAPAIQAEPTVGKSLFRINRDTRFSKDKTPYHPWMDAIWWEGHAEARRSPAFIFRLASDYLVVGTGIMGLQDGQLDRYRRAVADDTEGNSLQAALADLAEAHPDAELTAPTRKRVPAPYPDDHPRRDLLRLDTLHASRTLPLPADVSSGEFADWTADQLRLFAPVHRWLVDHLN